MSVLVYTENWDGRFKKLSFELVSYAKEVAAITGKPLFVLSVGPVEESELKKLGQYGAAKILSVNDPRLRNLENSVYSKIILAAAEKTGAEVIITANNNTGKAVAPRIAFSLAAGLVSGVSSLPSGISPFVVKKKVYNGKAIASIAVKSAKKVLTLAQNSHGMHESPVECSIENFNVPINDGDFKSSVNDVSKISGKIILTDAEIVVSGGRGMKGKEYWGPLEELAGLLGAATACSRPVSDEGWRPHEEHTGQTGKIIAPNLYFACGISGAIQHVAGVSSSKFIVAINKDKDAPIFEVADYGIIGDVHKVLPDLVNAVKEFKAEN